MLEQCFTNTWLTRKNSQRLLNFCQSVEFYPNLVTLFYVKLDIKCFAFGSEEGIMFMIPNGQLRQLKFDENLISLSCKEALHFTNP